MTSEMSGGGGGGGAGRSERGGELRRTGRTTGILSDASSSHSLRAQSLNVGAGLVPARAAAGRNQKPAITGAFLLPRTGGGQEGVPAGLYASLFGTLRPPPDLPQYGGGKRPGIGLIATPAGPHPGGDKPRPYVRTVVIYRTKVQVAALSRRRVQCYTASHEIPRERSPPAPPAHPVPGLRRGPARPRLRPLRGLGQHGGL